MRAPVSVAALLALSAAALMAEPWKDSELLQPAALAARLTNGAKPAILYVGPAVLFRSKHIPGAVLAGPAATAEGLALFRQTLARIPRNSEVVVYCGCCPWSVCPNIRPAFQVLRDMGFTNARLLSLPTSFYTDWISKGYPIEKAQP